MVSPLDAIDTFVIVILENRSFDHMLGYLNLPGSRRLASEGVQDDPAWLQQHANGGVQPFAMTTQLADDPPHEQATIALQLGKPAVPGGTLPMDGFVASYDTIKPVDRRLVMGYYGPDMMPVFDHPSTGVAGGQATITRTEARTHPPSAPSATPPAAVAQAVSKRAPGANANAAAFRLATLKIAAEHAGSAPGWPELARAAEAAQTSIG